jgi:hypothetical protein
MRTKQRFQLLSEMHIVSLDVDTIENVKQKIQDKDPFKSRVIFSLVRAGISGAVFYQICQEERNTPCHRLLLLAGTMGDSKQKGQTPG